MKKIKRRGFSKLRVGALIELPCAANIIPAGRYKIAGIDRDFVYFNFGTRAIFGLGAKWRKLLRRLPYGRDYPGLTTFEEFRSGYYQHYLDSLTAPPQPFDPAARTFCLFAMSEAAGFDPAIH